MSSLFYNRYVPPSSKPPDAELRHATEAELPRKRSKTAKPPASGAGVPPEVPQHQKLRRKYERSKNGVEEKQPCRSSVLTSAVDVDGSKAAEEISEKHGLVPLPQPAAIPDAPKVSVSAALPNWIRHPLSVSAELKTRWDELPLPSSTTDSLKSKGYQDALPIQEVLCRSLLPNLDSRYNGDICVSAATGSGKTLAYALPMIENLRGMPARKLRGLVIVPTRELVIQSKEVLELCARGSGLRIGTAVGSRSFREERDLLVEKGQRYDIQAYMEDKNQVVDELEELMDWDFDAMREPAEEYPLLPGWVVDYTSKVDILICTPGRLVEHIKSTPGFNLYSVQWMVIDEADRLLDDSFQQWVNLVLPQLDHLSPLKPLEEKLHRTFRILQKREVRKILLSATMTRDVSKLMALKLSRPRLVVLDSNNGQRGEEANDVSADAPIYTIPSSLAEIAVNVDDTVDKPLYLIQLLEHGIQAPGPSHNNQSAQRTSNIPGDLLGSAGSLADRDDMMSSSESSDPDTSLDSPSATPDVVAPVRGTLVFTSSTSNTTRLARLVSALRPSFAHHIYAFTKYTSKQDRKKALSSFAKSTIGGSPLPDYLPIIITTDVLSHGIDIPVLRQVVNYSVPSSMKDYIHRIGRTARADYPGTAVTLLENQQARWFWNEVARAPTISRSGKVTRGKVDMSRWGEEQREGYERALAELGQLARG